MATDPRTTPDRSRILMPDVRDHLDALDRMRNFGVDIGEDRSRFDNAVANQLRSSVARLNRFAKEHARNLPPNLQGLAPSIRSFVERVRFVRFSANGGSMVVPTAVATVGTAIAAGSRSVRDNFPLWYGGVFAGALLMYYGGKVWQELDGFSDADMDTPDDDDLEAEEWVTLDDANAAADDGVTNAIESALTDALAPSATAPVGSDSTVIEGSSGTVIQALRDAPDAQPVPTYRSTTPTAPRPSQGPVQARPDRMVEGDDARAALADIRGQRYGRGAGELDAAIAAASRRTGGEVSESDLYAYAYKESRFGRITNSTTSSAQGIFQHLPRVFDRLVQRYGDAYPVLRKGPNDPYAAAMGAALLIKENRTGYQKRTGREATTTDSYILYLLGQGSGTKFLDSVRTTPGRKAALDFPKQAAANKSVFYADKGKGAALTYRQVYAALHQQVGSVAVAVEANRGSLRADSEDTRLQQSRPGSTVQAPTGAISPTSSASPVTYEVGGAAPSQPLLDAQVSATNATTGRPGGSGPSPIMLADASSLWSELVNDSNPSAPEDEVAEDDLASSSLVSNGRPSAEAAASNYIRLPNGLVIQL